MFSLTVNDQTFKKFYPWPQVGPRFLRMPQNVVTVEKGDVEFECEVYSVPPATIQWYKNGDLIIESEYFQVKLL